MGLPFVILVTLLIVISNQVCVNEKIYTVPENLLISNGTLKISDFGLSGICNKDKNFFSTICGTPHYGSCGLFKS